MLAGIEKYVVNSSFLRVLLDLTAAFDTVDHKILISRQEEWVGITASALQWFRSYFSDRRFCLMMDDFLPLPSPGGYFRVPFLVL